MVTARRGATGASASLPAAFPTSLLLAVYLGSHLVESLSDIMSCFGGHFHVKHLVVHGKVQRLLCTDTSLDYEVGFSAIWEVWQLLHQVQFEAD